MRVFLLSASGLTELQRIPVPVKRSAVCLVKPITAALLVTYEAPPVIIATFHYFIILKHKFVGFE